MEKYKDIFLNSFSGYFNYLVDEIQSPFLIHHFWWLVGLSLSVLSIEIIVPWREN
jgi:hypothetical protein